MAMDASFYKNVFLLMQLVPASYECTILFKKGMFDKPNTSGFIHISHYLLSIYNAKQFQKMVVWPIMNKMDEKKYRMEIKEYLEIVAKENPDINFPTVLMTHLLQAGGTKFFIIMWKLSQISLRTYITKKCQKVVLQMPSIGNNKDVTQLYFRTKNLKQSIIISKFCEKTTLISEHFKYYMKRTSNDLTKIRTNIFEIEENLVKYIPALPVNSLVAMQLINTENTEIINLWKENINENIKYLHKKNLELKRLQDLSSMLCVLSMSSYSKSFDCSSLPKVSNDIIPLYLGNGAQLNYGLYMNGNLVFHNLFLILHQVLKQLYYCFKKTYVSELFNYEPKIIDQSNTLKFQEMKLQKLIKQISDMICNVQYNLQEKTVNCTYETGVLLSVDSEKILISPKFSFFRSEYIDENEKLFKKLWCSPIQGKYKYLFTRYKCLFNSPKSPVIKLQFNDSIDNIALNWKSPQRLSLSNRANSPNKIKVSPRYSRLFSTSNLKTTYFKDNNAASTPKPSRMKISPKKTAIQTANAEINVNLAMKNIFYLSDKIKKVVASLSKS